MANVHGVAALEGRKCGVVSVWLLLLLCEMGCSEFERMVSPF